MPQEELNIPSHKEVLQLIAQKAYGGLTKRVELPENYSKELTKETRRKVEEVMLSAQSGGIHKAQAVPKLLAGLFKKKMYPLRFGKEVEASLWELLFPIQRKNVTRAMSEIMVAPQKELKELKQIVWRGKAIEDIKGEYFGRRLAELGKYGPPETIPRIELNPYRVDKTTFMHEIIHKKHDFPQPGEERLAKGLMKATSEAWDTILDQLYRREGFGSRVPKDVAENFYFAINQMEAMARDLPKVVLWKELEGVYKTQLPRYSARAEQWLDKIAGKGASGKMWERLLKVEREIK